MARSTARGRNRRCRGIQSWCLDLHNVRKLYDLLDLNWFWGSPRRPAQIAEHSRNCDQATVHMLHLLLRQFENLRFLLVHRFCPFILWRFPKKCRRSRSPGEVPGHTYIPAPESDLSETSRIRVDAEPLDTQLGQKRHAVARDLAQTRNRPAKRQARSAGRLKNASRVATDPSKAHYVKRVPIERRLSYTSKQPVELQSP